MAKSRGIGSIVILQIALGAFFFILGLQGVIGYDSTMNEIARGVGKLMGTSDNSTLLLILAILEMIAGIVLVMGVFLKVKDSAVFFAGIAILILWGINIFMTFFGDGIPEGKYLLPWLRDLSLYLVVFVSIWTVTKH